MKQINQHPNILRFIGSAVFTVLFLASAGQIQISHTDVTCPTAADGSAEVTAVNNGTPPFTYSWSNGAATRGISGLEEGSYTVVVMDANGCYGTKNVEIELSMKTLVTTLFSTSESCDNVADGTAGVYVSGGLQPYSYQWSTGSSTQTIDQLSAGEYCVTVTDVNKCRGSGCVTVQKSVDAFPVSIPYSNDVSCFGKSDGWAMAVAIGGTPPHTFEWSNGSAGPSANGLSAGFYSVTATDNNGCHGNANVSIGEPPELNLDISAMETFIPDCDDKESPVTILTATPYGGTPYYTYSWPGGSIQVSSDGTYCCTVTDVDGCSANKCAMVEFIALDCPHDPNALTGPTGFAEPHWVSVNDKLTYTAEFENDPNLATAPAQEVRIKVPLNDKVDPYSLRIGNFGFGYFDFTVPTGSSFYQKRLDVRDSLGVYVDVTAGLDVVNHEAFWILQSIDPATGLPPNNPQTGLLPVNDSVFHRGEGFVTFTIKPKQSDQTGDTINAVAQIIFDVNAPIVTNGWFNTVDALPPVSSVNPLPVAFDTTAFSIGFTGNDDPGGCGISKFKLYYSKDASAFALWGEYDPGTTVAFNGQKNSTYGFFSLAVDHVGNTEPMKTVADAITAIPGVCTISPTIAHVSCYSYSDGAISLSLTGGISPYSFAWSNGATDNDLIALSAGVYYATVTDGLSRQTTGSWQVNEPPAWSIDMAGPAEACPNMPGYQYGSTFADPANPGADYTYQWIVNGGVLTSGQNTDTISVTWQPGIQGKVDLLLSRAGDGCMLGKSSDITLLPVLTLTSNIETAETMVCSGTPVTLTCTNNYPVSGYDWYVNEVVVSHTAALTYVPNDGDHIYCRCWATENGCWASQSAVSNSLIINLYPVPPPVQAFAGITVVNQQSVCYSALQAITVGGAGPFYIETGGGVNLIAGQTIRLLPGVKVEQGGYLHGYISDNCLWCSALPSNQKFALQPGQPGDPSMIESLTGGTSNHLFRVYPNPTTGTFTLELSAAMEKSIVKAELYGMYGERLLNVEFSGVKKQEFTLERKPSGVYFIRVICGDKTGSQKIIKQ